VNVIDQTRTMFSLSNSCTIFMH